MSFKLSGLIAAMFTPLNKDQSLNLDLVPSIVEHLVANGISGAYIAGSTGEGPSLTREERHAVVEAYVKAIDGRMKTVVQVGHNSLEEAKALATHAKEAGADAISSVSPSYFKPQSVEELVECIAVITSGAPDLPYYYYNIPHLSGVAMNMVEFLRLGSKQIPSLAGIKFSAPFVHEVQACLEVDGGRFNILFGVDEMLLSGVAAGVDGAIGTTYSYLAPLYQAIMDAYAQRDTETARKLQATSARLIDIILGTCGRAGLKHAMALIGLDCGTHRLPLKDASPASIEEMKKKLDAAGFFEWTGTVTAG